MSVWEQMSTHLADNVASYLVLSVALGVLAIALAVLLLLRWRSAVKPLSRLSADSANPSELMQAVLRAAEETEARIGRLESRVTTHVEESRLFIRHVSLVRYDAFEDIAGRQSFSMCLLNADHDGVLITYLSGKSATRSYAVAIEKGKSSRKLSEEETQSLNGALSGKVLEAV